MNRFWLAHLALFGANLIYGLNYTIAKEVMPDYIQPFGFIFCRVTGALVIFWIFSSLAGTEKIEKSDFPRLVICGLTGVAINQLLFFKGLNLSVPTNASIIMTTNPILVLIMATILARERLNWYKSLGIGFGISGALLLLTVKKGFELGGGNWLGDSLIFVNAASYALYLVLVKKLMGKYKAITVIKWVFLFGYLVVTPVGIGEFLEIKWEIMPMNIIMQVMFVVLGTTVLSYFFNIYALKIVSPTVASSYIYLQPILGSAFAIWLGKDELTLVKILAAFLTFTGVYLVSRPGCHKT